MSKKTFWKNLKKPTLALSPMAGITDIPFRIISKELGADLVYSEMASSSALFFAPQKTLELIKYTPKEKPYVVQLFGNDPKHFAKAAKIVEKEISPQGIDINFGCPAPKIFKNQSGCFLMQDKKLSRQIIQSVCQNTSLPVSLKIRAGIKNITALDFLEAVGDLPFDGLMIHGRTYEQGFSGENDFEMIEKIKSMFPKKTILANGGITNSQKAREIIQKYPTFDGIGIARGALGQPWIFREIKDSSQDIDFSKDKNYIKKIVQKHLELMLKYKKEKTLIEMRKHWGWYFRGFSGAKEIRKKLIEAQNIKEIKSIIKKLS